MAALKSIHIDNLQRLNNIPVSFNEKGVTAIMGANGSGKTTLLQALACVYKKRENLGEPLKSKQKNYRYDDFFKDYNDINWLNSKFTVEFYGREEPVEYSKGNSGWIPQTGNKTHRYVKYINVSECVPHQEIDMDIDVIGDFDINNIDLSTAKKSTLLEKISGAMSKNYTDAGYGNKNTGLSDFFYTRTAKRSGQDEFTYPSHYMGTGEQKLIYVIKEVLQAPPQSLILIEELDFALHENSLRSLINVLIQEANERNLQIVFTTHWLGIQDFQEQIQICSLRSNPESEEVEIYTGFDPQFVYSIDGSEENLRQIKVWVEDSLAGRILHLLGQTLGIRQFMSIKEFGSLPDAYTVAAASVMNGDGLDRIMIVTDGDRDRSIESKRNLINQKIASEGERANEWKETALSLIVDFNTQEGIQPEKTILDMCKQRRAEDIFPDWLRGDLTWLEQQIPAVDGKAAFKKLQEYKDIEMSEVERIFLDEAIRNDAWNEYILPIKTRLIGIAQSIGITDIREAA